MVARTDAASSRPRRAILGCPFHCADIGPLSVSASFAGFGGPTSWATIDVHILVNGDSLVDELIDSLESRPAFSAVLVTPCSCSEVCSHWGCDRSRHCSATAENDGDSFFAWVSIVNGVSRAHPLRLVLDVQMTRPCYEQLPGQVGAHLIWRMVDKLKHIEQAYSIEGPLKPPY